VPCFCQELFALKVLSAGKPTAVVLVNGGALAIDNLIPSSPAIVEAFYPGKNAQAVANALFGVTNRFGRLPYTMYPSAYVEQVDMNNMSMQAGPGRTYKFYTGMRAAPSPSIRCV
jgi:beta-D-xylosidase 4